MNEALSELRRSWGQNIELARKVLNSDGKLRRSDEEPMSQSRLAELINVTQQTVSDWERGETAPRDDMKVRIAEVVHQDVRQLFPLTRGVAGVR